MSENLARFFEMLQSDAVLAKHLLEAKSADEAYAVAGEAVEGFDKEEFLAAMRQAKAAADEADAELSPDNLEGAAGGIDDASDTVFPIPLIIDYEDDEDFSEFYRLVRDWEL